MMFRTTLATLACAVALPLAGVALAQDAPLTVTFADAAWTGETIPEGQHCQLQGGTGASPALHIEGVPEGTTIIEVAFNDETYTPMDDGGHGVLHFAVTPENSEVDLPSVAANAADDLPEGVSVATAARGEGDYASAGYLPPCSGGQGNTYSATIRALNDDEQVLGTGEITLGTY